ncbi:MAG: metallophosphoesterase family protein [Candidatus Aminicenantes bacterium]|nr:metallophosphoesterase family protein [Candidatus Aminicenantes bacterium]
MRYLIFTDIHGNLEAFKKVLSFSKKKRIDHHLFLGDLVGYGASPNECIQKIQSLTNISTVRGNHDKAVCTEESIKAFNPIAAAAILWTQKNLRKKNLNFLCKIKKGPKIINNDITICHGTPFDEDAYIFGEFDAAEAFLHMRTQICFFGHTHFPYVYTEKNGLVQGQYITKNVKDLKIEPDTRYLINPGSVGQPRDRDNRAGFAVYDSDKNVIDFYRVNYNIENAQKKILSQNLPPALAERLTLGI